MNLALESRTTFQGNWWGYDFWGCLFFCFIFFDVPLFVPDFCGRW